METIVITVWSQPGIFESLELTTPKAIIITTSIIAVDNILINPMFCLKK